MTRLRPHLSRLAILLCLGACGPESGEDSGTSHAREMRGVQRIAGTEGEAWVVDSAWASSPLPDAPEQGAPLLHVLPKGDRVPPLLQVVDPQLLGLEPGAQGQVEWSADPACWKLHGGLATLHDFVPVPERTHLVLTAQVEHQAGSGFQGFVVRSLRRAEAPESVDELIALSRDPESRTFPDLYVASPGTDESTVAALGSQVVFPEVPVRSVHGVETWRVELPPTMFGTRSLGISAVHGLGADPSADPDQGYLNLLSLELRLLTPRTALGRVLGGSTLVDLPDRSMVDLDRRLALVRCDGESRRSLLLARGAVANAEHDLGGESAGWVRLGLCVVPEARLTTAGPFAQKVKVSVVTGTTTQSREVELAVKAHEPSYWTEIQVPCSSARAVTLRIEVAGEDSVDGPLVAVSDPLWYPNLPRTAPRPPNLLWISLDTLRADRIGKQVQGSSLTPRIDSLATSSWVAEQALSNASYTLPSHVSMFTGQYPDTHGLFHPLQRLDPSASRTFGEVLAAHGYATAAYTAGAMLNAEFCGLHRGFDRYAEIDPCLSDQDPLPERVPRWYDPEYNQALFERYHYDRMLFPWLELHARQGTPFFAFLHTYLVHDYHPRADLGRRYAPRPDAVPGDAAPLWDSGAGRTGVTASSLTRLDPTDPAQFRRERDLPYVEGLYDATVAQADEVVGSLLDQLQRLGLAENTIVVLCSDHGEEFLEHGGLSHARTLYEEMLRVPLIVHVPGRAPHREAAPVESVDLAPSLLRLLSLDPGELHRVDGRASIFDPPPNAESWIGLASALVETRSGFERLDAARGATRKAVRARSVPPPRAGALSPVAVHQLTAQGYLEPTTEGSSSEGSSAQRTECFDLADDPGERRPVDPAQAPAAFDPLLERLGARRSGGGRP